MEALLRSFAGFLISVCFIHASAAVHYVNLGSTNPVPPFTNWNTAATVIQDALDAASKGDEVVVTNGIYAAGNRKVGIDLLANRVVVALPLVLRSVNGPSVTVIQGLQPAATTNGGATARCVYLMDGASLSGFTLTNGGTAPYAAGASDDEQGGGIFCESVAAFVTNCLMVGNGAGFYGGGAYSGTLSHCALSGNSALAGGGAAYSTLDRCILTSNSVSGDPGLYDLGVGGGAYWSDLTNCVLAGNLATVGGGAGKGFLANCLLTNNIASGYGGGAFAAQLNNCTIVANQAPDVGGADESTIFNSIIYYNTGTNSPNFSSCFAQYCCTTPQPSGFGVQLVGNITSPPLFVDQAAGDLHLQANSPCIDAGNNTDAPGPTDLDGNPRVVGGTVDLGAYESQASASLIPAAWLRQFGLPTDGSANFTDPDGDGMNNWQEWIAGTNPTNALSVLKLMAPVLTNRARVAVTWQSVSNRTYFLQRATNLSAPSSFLIIQTNLAGQAGTTTFIDTNAGGGGARFYRVGVQQ